MENKDGFEKKLERFLTGKGYYIVLTLCVVVIGVSAYFLLTNMSTNSGVNPLDNVASVTGTQQPVVAIPPQVEPDQFGEPAVEPVEDPALDALTQTTETGLTQEPAAEIPMSPQFIWPVFGEVSLPYSVTSLVFNQKMGDWRTNDGVELAVDLGTQVLAISAGRVVSVTSDEMSGTCVAIEHAGGLKSYYSNLQSIPTVYEGDNVITGEVIGSVGVTALGEKEEKPNLCFRMTLDGQSVDPSNYLPPR